MIEIGYVPSPALSLTLKFNVANRPLVLLSAKPFAQFSLTFFVTGKLCGPLN